jgi:hypothetical protein
VLAGLFLLLVPVLESTSTAQAQVFSRTSGQGAKANSFGTIIEGPDLVAPERTEAADVDGDGDPDVIAYSGATGELVWYENQSDGFGTGRVIASELRADEIHSADLTQNGRADVLVVDRDSGLLWYRSNVGTSGADADGFGEALTIDSEVGSSITIATGSLDGDNDPEVIVDDTYYDNQIGENGADTDGFADATTISIIYPVAAVKDVDGDGDRDIVTSTRTIRWFSNQRVESGAVSFQAERFGVEFMPLAVGPIDTDGDIDILGYDGGEDEIVWLENQMGESGADSDGFASLQTVGAWDTGRPSFKSTHLADVDGDGDLDAVPYGGEFTQIFLRKAYWYENQIGEGGGFGDQTTAFTTGGEIRNIDVAQMDGSGGQDILAAIYGGSRIAYYPSNTSASSGFGSGVTITSPGPLPGAEDVVAADFDGDGDPDIATAARLADRVAWHENELGESVADADGFGDPQIVSENESNVSSIFAADLDGDGDPDLVSFSSNRVVWHENQLGESGADSDGFSVPRVISTDVSEGKGSLYGRGVFVGDLDGGGDPDVAVADTGGVAWHENQLGESGADSDGFGPRKVISASDERGAEDLTITEVDGDGRPDIIVTTTLSDVIWYRNQIGTSSADDDGFEGGRTLSGSASAEAIFSTDLDEDGRNDVLTDSKWFRNRIGGPFPDQDGFGDPQRFSGIGGGDILAADVDGDGDRDPVGTSTSSSSGTILWTQNTIVEGTAVGSGSPTQTITQRLVGPSGLATTDLDGDGDLDLIAVTDIGGRLAWFENQSATGPTASTSASRRVSASGTSSYGDTGVRIRASGVGGSGQLSVRRFETPPEEPEGITEENVSSYRVVIENRGALTVGDGTEVRFDADNFPGINDPGAVTVYSRPGPGNGTFQPLKTSYDAGTNEIVATTSSFSEFVFASDATNPLPIEITSFTAQTDGDGDGVALTWTTASETEIGAFQVQRRSETGEWSTIGRREAAGTTSKTQRYRFNDESVPYEADSLAYRLRQVDTDGTAHLSKIVTIDRTLETAELLGTYPNPARTQATVRLAIPEAAAADARLQLYDVLGRRVRSVDLGQKPGRQVWTLDVGGLASGVYFLRLRAGDATKTQRLTVVK